MKERVRERYEYETIDRNLQPVDEKSASNNIRSFILQGRYPVQRPSCAKVVGSRPPALTAKRAMILVENFMVPQSVDMNEKVGGMGILLVDS